MNAFSEISEILNNPFGVSGFVQVATSKYKDIFVSASDKTLIQVWNTRTEKLTNDEIQEQANFLLNQVIAHTPAYIITDQRLYRHNLTYEQQNWYVTHFVPKLLSNRIFQFAFILNENLLHQAKLEEIIDDVEKFRSEFLIPTRFFTSIKEALQWK